jgi:hypothetical protein
MLADVRFPGRELFRVMSVADSGPGYGQMTCELNISDVGSEIQGSKISFLAMHR